MLCTNSRTFLSHPPPKKCPVPISRHFLYLSPLIPQQPLVCFLSIYGFTYSISYKLNPITWPRMSGFFAVSSSSMLWRMSMFNSFLQLHGYIIFGGTGKYVLLINRLFCYFQYMCFQSKHHFHFLNVRSNAAMNICIQGLVWTNVLGFSCKQICWVIGNFLINLWRNCQSFPKLIALFYILTNSA